MPTSVLLLAACPFTSKQWFMNHAIQLPAIYVQAARNKDAVIFLGSAGSIACTAQSTLSQCLKTSLCNN